jgi:hypothetical protein
MDQELSLNPNAGEPYDLEAQRELLKRLCQAPRFYYYWLQGVWGHGLGSIFIANILAVVIVLRVPDWVAQKSLVFGIIVSFLYMISLAVKPNPKFQREPKQSIQRRVVGFRGTLRLLKPVVFLWIVVAAIQISAYAKWGAVVVFLIWGLSVPALLILPFLALIGYLRFIMSVNRITKGDKNIAYANRKGLHISRHWLLEKTHIKPSLIVKKLEMASKGHLHIVD